VPTYDDVRTTLDQLEAAGVDCPDVELKMHRPPDDYVTRFVAALQGWAWSAVHGSSAAWLYGIDPDSKMSACLFVNDPGGPTPTPPALARARALLAQARP
jgi:hypothetical protein